jgi:hypothetical protein
MVYRMKALTGDSPVTSYCYCNAVQVETCFHFCAAGAAVANFALSTELVCVQPPSATPSPGSSPSTSPSASASPSVGSSPSASPSASPSPAHGGASAPRSALAKIVSHLLAPCLSFLCP